MLPLGAFFAPQLRALVPAFEAFRGFGGAEQGAEIEQRLVLIDPQLPGLPSGYEGVSWTAAPQGLVQRFGGEVVWQCQQRAANLLGRECQQQQVRFEGTAQGQPRIPGKSLLAQTVSQTLDIA